MPMSWLSGNNIFRPAKVFSSRARYRTRKLAGDAGGGLHVGDGLQLAQVHHHAGGCNALHPGDGLQLAQAHHAGGGLHHHAGGGNALHPGGALQLAHEETYL